MQMPEAPLPHVEERRQYPETRTEPLKRPGREVGGKLDDRAKYGLAGYPHHCYTGIFSSAHLSFAASLVDRGVAMALGMAGEVADRACQAFTLRFYQALMTDQPV
jgi:hypothetical protein